MSDYLHTISCVHFSSSEINVFLSGFASCEEWEVEMHLPSGATFLHTNSAKDAGIVAARWGK